jgi:hypothetical protein
MAERHSEPDVESGGGASSDRLWILASSRSYGSSPGHVQSEGRRPTLVVRDRDRLLIRIDVGRGSPLALPFGIEQASCAGATLIVRLSSEATPCAACIDEHVESAAAALGGLDAAGVFRAIRAGTARCAAAPPHAAPDEAGSAPPESASPRSHGALRLAPPNAPHVPAGVAPSAEGEMDVLLII